MKFTLIKKHFGYLILFLLITINTIFARSVPRDFDGDGKTDLSVQRLDANNNYIWYILQTRSGFSATKFGGNVAGNFIDGSVDGDYDGDGKTDIAIIRIINNDPNIYWIILNSRDNLLMNVTWGNQINDYLMPQDYDGDGKTDIAVFRSGWWYIRRSSDSQLYAEQFGSINDRPLIGGDYDGDGKADLAVVRWGAANPVGTAIPTTLYLRLSRDGTWAAYNLGNAQFTGVLSGDYDGDGRADVAIWQGNLWLWIRSSDNKLEGIRFGYGTLSSQDKPIIGDYDGDGKYDPAVYRAGSGNCTLPPQQQSYFYVQRSRDGFWAMPWGLTCDVVSVGREYLPAVGF